MLFIEDCEEADNSDNTTEAVKTKVENSIRPSFNKGRIRIRISSNPRSYGNAICESHMEKRKATKWLDIANSIKLIVSIKLVHDAVILTNSNARQKCKRLSYILFMFFFLFYIFYTYMKRTQVVGTDLFTGVYFQIYSLTYKKKVPRWINKNCK